MADRDGELVRRYRAGTKAAMTLLIETHRAAVYERHLTLSQGNADVAEAATDATFLSAAIRIGDLADPRQFGTWILALADAEHARVAARHKAGELPTAAARRAASGRSAFGATDPWPSALPSGPAGGAGAPGAAATPGGPSRQLPSGGGRRPLRRLALASAFVIVLAGAGAAGYFVTVANKSANTSATANSTGADGIRATASPPPSASALRGALLTEADLGGAFQKVPDSSGISPLLGAGADVSQGTSGHDGASASASDDPSNGASVPPGCKNPSSAMFDGSGTSARLAFSNHEGTLVAEGLVSAPSGQLTAIEQLAAMLKKCVPATITQGATTIVLSGAPVAAFPSAELAVSLRFIVDGTELDGYLVYARLSDTVSLSYMFVDLPGTSAEAAHAFYAQAVLKAQQALHPSSPTTSAAA